MAGERRLVFWLQLSFAGDFLLAAIAVALLWSDETAGWYLLVFVFLRAVIGAVALFWIAPRAARDLGQKPPPTEDE
ncbi:hypothetical protein [Naasia sp. SYSU D00057]|uniref:hypothetical protein n=1 Tax=Naasia sp. SYSU D00057 TaxID=2817380 RepID=UPI001B315444|nr:hypothetical protein [Naasia sp. SYSU D00057]